MSIHMNFASDTSALDILEHQFLVCMFGNRIFCMEQQFLVSLVLVSFFFELLSEILSMRQAICDLDVMSSEFSSISTRVHSTFSEEFHSIP